MKLILKGFAVCIYSFFDFIITCWKLTVYFKRICNLKKFNLKKKNTSSPKQMFMLCAHSLERHSRL